MNVNNYQINILFLPSFSLMEHDAVPINQNQNNDDANSQSSQALEVMECHELLKNLLGCPGMKEYLEAKYEPGPLATINSLAEDDSLVLFSMKRVAAR